MPSHPLAEVFGFPANNLSEEANRSRRNRLCPFNNRVPNCTKDKANNPLGVCSIYHNSDTVITCPIRFREGWVVAEHAASFFFPANATWTSLTEVRLNDRYGRAAGNVDVVLVSYDSGGRIIDFGALEVQAVYISGNIRQPFEHYMADPQGRKGMDWSRQPNYPRPDYLSSSRKRLAPQLLYKGGIINTWKRKIAVAVGASFYGTLPDFEQVDPADADLAWLIYDLQRGQTDNHYSLHLNRAIYSRFDLSLNQITHPHAGDVQEFIGQLQEKLDDLLEDENPPDAPILDVIL